MHTLYCSGYLYIRFINCLLYHSYHKVCGLMCAYLIRRLLGSISHVHQPPQSCCTSFGLQRFYADQKLGFFKKPKTKTKKLNAQFLSELFTSM